VPSRDSCKCRENSVVLRDAGDNHQGGQSPNMTAISTCRPLPASPADFSIRERPIQVKQPLYDVPIYRHKNSDVEFRCLVVYQN